MRCLERCAAERRTPDRKRLVKKNSTLPAREMAELILRVRLGLELGQKKVTAPMDHLELLYKPAAIVPGGSNGRLVVVSNRVPLASSSAAPAAGGLAVALKATLKARGGLWFGWSGNTSEQT
jgi:hypothetical protein